MPSYAPSKTVVNPTQVATLLAAGNAANSVAAYFTAPQGPDVPIPNLSPQQAQQVYGLASSPLSLGYTGPLGIQVLGSQAQTRRSSPINIVGCRVGVTRASAILGGLTLQGIGAYAGSRGNALAVQTTVGGATSAITSVIVVDTSAANAPVFAITSAQGDLSSWQAIADRIAGAQPVANPSSVVTVSAVNSATAYPGVAVAAPGTAFTGGLDGKGATASDPTIASLMQQSVAYRADYGWAAFDAAAIAPTVLAHLSAAIGANNYRFFGLGAATGTPYTTLAGSYTTPFLSDRLQCVGHDLAFMANPVTGAGDTYAGFYEAAALVALKASGPRRVTCNKNQPLNGFTGFGNTGVTGPLSPSQMDALGAAGLTVLRQTAANGPITIRDNITTTPEYPAGSNNVNIFYQVSMRDVDNAVEYALYQAVDPFSGQARLDSSSDVADITYALNTAVAQLGDTTNGLGPGGIQLSIDPATGRPQAAVNLLYPFPYGEIDITPIVGF